MRPAWEQGLTWGVADHLVRGGVSREQAFWAAALVVRGLDRAHNLAAEVARRPIVSPADLDDVDNQTPKFREVLEGFWRRIGAPLGSRREVRRLLLTAAYAYRSAPLVERQAAAQLARDAVAVEALKGPAGGTPGDGWDGFGKLAINLPFAGLREEVVGAVPADQQASVGTYYDDIAGSDSARADMVRLFQDVARSQGLYSRSIDGAWGTGSESAYRSMTGAAESTLSTLADVRRIVDASGGRINFGVAVGVAITRDRWLASRGQARPAPTEPTAPPDPSAEEIRNLVEVSSPKPPEPDSGEPSGGPSAQQSETATRVDIRLPPERESVAVREVSGEASGMTTTTKVLLALGAALAIGGVVMVVSNRSREDSEEER